MLNSLRTQIDRLVGSQKAGGRKTQQSRISRSGMPNGFFFDDLLWFGESGSKRTAVARGFIVEPPELEILDEQSKEDLSNRLRLLLVAVAEEYMRQVKYLVYSDC